MSEKEQVKDKMGEKRERERERQRQRNTITVPQTYETWPPIARRSS